MRDFARVKCQIEECSGRTFLELMDQLCSSTDTVNFDEEYTKSFEQWGESVCAVFILNCENRLYRIHMYEDSDGSFAVANIQPSVAKNLSCEDYNRIADRWILELRSYFKRQGVPVKLTRTSGNLGLKDVITGAKARSKFERVLGARRHQISMK